MKKNIEKVFSLNDKSDIIEFCMAYAIKNQEFAKQLIKRFLPQKESDAKDKFAGIDKELAKCFKCPAKKGYYDNWGLDLDWYAIGEKLGRLIDKGKYMAEKGFIHEAIYLAMEVLRKTAKEYDEGCAYEDHDLTGDDLYLEDAISLLEGVVGSDTISREEKLKIANELEKIAEMDAYDSYCLCEFDHLIEEIQKSQLSTEEYVDQLKSEFVQAPDYSKGGYAAKLFDYYLEQNLISEAETWAKLHLKYSNIIYRYSHWLTQQQRLNDALLMLDIGINHSAMDSHNKSEWERDKLGIYESLGNTEHIIEQSRKLFILEFRFIQYYQKLKKLIDSKEWHNYLEELLSHKEFNGDASGELPQIYNEEKRYNELFDLLNKSKSYLLSAFKTYATSLTKEQQTTLVIKIEKALQDFAKNQMGRDNYKTIAKELNILRGSCGVGRASSEKLVAELRATYRNRPAMLDELKEL